MTIRHETPPTPEQNAEQVLILADQVLKGAVEIAFPESPNLDPLQAFPKPTEVRAESSDIPELTDDRKALLLAKASELGFGKAEDVSLSEQGLIGASVIIEGGLVHKMLAEASMVVDDQSAQPNMLIISASPYREIKNDAEIASAQRLFGRVGRTEYEVASDVVRALPGFTEYLEPKVLNASYDIDNNFVTSQEPTGQFQVIGDIQGIPVLLMRIDRINLDNGNYEKQPGTAAVLGIVDDVIKASGDNDSPLVHVTSGTYRPSRAVGVALASLSTNRVVGIATYGNNRLNAIKGDNTPAPLNQLPGELHAMAEQTIKLRTALDN